MTTTPTAPPALTDDDLAAYLHRIGHTGGPPTLATLQGIVRSHVLAVPFENVDVLLGRHRGIALDVVTEKLTRRRRGGYCYEQNALVAAALERLGFDVRRIRTRINPDGGGPGIHMALIVRPVDAEEQLIDVGFGADMPVPVPLRDGAEVDGFGWLRRIEDEGPTWLLSCRTARGWEAQYRFTTDPATASDYEVGHHYCSTHPDSPFVGRLVVMRLEPGLSRRLVGRELIVERADGTCERHDVADPVAALAALDVDLDPDETDALRRWWAQPA